MRCLIAIVIRDDNLGGYLRYSSESIRKKYPAADGYRISDKMHIVKNENLSDIEWIQILFQLSGIRPK